MFGNYPYYPPHLPTALPVWRINSNIMQDIAACEEILETNNLFICIQYGSLHIGSFDNNIDIVFQGGGNVSVTEFSVNGIKAHSISAKREDLKSELARLLENIRNK